MINKINNIQNNTPLKYEIVTSADNRKAAIVMIKDDGDFAAIKFEKLDSGQLWVKASIFTRK